MAGITINVITQNTVVGNNKFCPKSMDTPVKVRGGGILLLGATRTLVAHNTVNRNHGHQINSGGIVVLSAKKLTTGTTRATTRSGPTWPPVTGPPT
jgi:hypothetical protein